MIVFGQPGGSAPDLGDRGDSGSRSNRVVSMFSMDDVLARRIDSAGVIPNPSCPIDSAILFRRLFVALSDSATLFRRMFVALSCPESLFSCTFSSGASPKGTPRPTSLRLSGFNASICLVKPSETPAPTPPLFFVTIASSSDADNSDLKSTCENNEQIENGT